MIHFPRGWWLWRRDRRRQRGRLSPIMLRILAVNVMALALLVGSLLYLGRYQERLIAAELDSLLLQARLSANALGEGAVVIDEEEHSILSPLLARLMIRRLVEATDTRTRLFDLDDTLLADSRVLLERGARIQVQQLPEPAKDDFWLIRLTMRFFNFFDRLAEQRHFPLYQEEAIQRGDHYEIVRKALKGEPTTQVWSAPQDGLLLAVAVPVQRYKKVLGAVMLSHADTRIDVALREVRLNILELFGVTLLITTLLSVYLARAIARPIRLLAIGAERVRHGESQIVGLAGTAKLLNRDIIPDLSARHDEIGDLSVALRDMTAALAQRISAIENFAADVAHEIKNPLTSLRSAVETIEKVQDPERQRQLMLVIRDDVDRMDRLITDISSASRLDAELGRAEIEPVDVGKMLSTLVDFYDGVSATARERGEPPMATVALDALPQRRVTVLGVELRIVQVMQNLIANALSFSPPDKRVALSVDASAGLVRIQVDDEGPGIPDNKLEAIFDRFYSERPKTEKFGMHSGLGLSLSKQIVEAHHGRIWAENRRDSENRVIGARFVVELTEMKSEKTEG